MRTRSATASCSTEHVIVTYKGGRKRRIAVFMDSYAAIIRDVAKGF